MPPLTYLGNSLVVFRYYGCVIDLLCVRNRSLSVECVTAAHKPTAADESHSLGLLNKLNLFNRI